MASLARPLGGLIWNETLIFHKAQERPQGVSLVGAMAYAAPVTGGYLFYSAIGQIVPGIYAKYFGLSLTSIAAVALIIRLFDGVSDLTIGYLSDRHRAAGGSRKPWVVVGSLGVIVACYFLFQPPQPATITYYLAWSLIYYLAFTIAEIPHCTWGSELTLDYQQRAKIFGVRGVAWNIGVLTLYALPLLPLYASTAYTPEVLHDAVFVGALLMVVGLVWTLLAAPAGIAINPRSQDSWRQLRHSVLRNKPLLIYFGGIGCIGLYAGMWFGLLFFYLDTYLALGSKVGLILFVGTLAALLSTPLWLQVIRHTSKSIAWGLGVALFVIQLGGMWFVSPADTWWMAFGLIMMAKLFLSCHAVAAFSILGDIVDYGKLKFHQDRGGTYFGSYNLLFKVGLGIGGGLSIGIAGLFGFNPSQTVHSAESIFGLKLGFVILPMCFALLGLLFIWRLPIDRRRHRIIQRRLESRLIRSERNPPFDNARSLEAIEVRGSL